MSLVLLYFTSMIIKYKKCKSWREFNKILRKYAKRYYKTRRQFGRCTLDCPWWIWVEYDIDTYTELQSLYKYYLSHKHRFWTNLNKFIKEAIDNYGKEFLVVILKYTEVQTEKKINLSSSAADTLKELEKKLVSINRRNRLLYMPKLSNKYAFDMLEKAYEHEECDQETVNLLFEAHIGILAWGSHHFPEGCILERDKASFEIDTCKSILQNHAVEDSLLDALDYFERLYSCYFKYVDDGRVKDFDLYCIEEQIEFEPINAFFYM